MFCQLCDVSKLELDHDISPKHLKNIFLDKFSKNIKKHSANRDGIIITCDVTTSAQTIDGFVGPKLQTSALPDEVVMFKFKVYNDMKTKTIKVLGSELIHSRINFTMTSGVVLGEETYLLKPKTYLPKEVTVTFTSSNTGQYNMPIIFYFLKENDNTLIIARDLIVMVERYPKSRQVTENPYKGKPVIADTYLPAISGKIQRGAFRVPKQLSLIFTTCLQMKNPTEEESALIADIKKSLSAGVTIDNYSLYFHNLLWYEESINKKFQRKYNMSGVPLSCGGNSYILRVPGLAEKRPYLMKDDRVFVKLHDDEDILFEGIISKADAANEEITIENFHSLDYYSTEKRYDVRFLMARVPLERMHVAVDATIMSHLNKVFPSLKKNPAKITPITSFFNPLVGCNLEQRTAVEQIVSRSSGDAPYILHGPPGTGKTITIVEAILQIAKSSTRNKIFVCAESNMAADHIAVTILKYLNKFQEECFLLRANSKCRNWATHPKELENYSINGVKRSKVNSSRIVVLTNSHSAMYKGANATHLFIDEAAQSSEPSSMVPITSLLAPNGMLVLAGDHRQLGPVIISKDAAEEGLGISLMERLMKTNSLYDKNDPNYTVMLKKNFRSHPDILEIPNTLFYDGLLTAQVDTDPLTNTDILGDKTSSRAIVFHGCSSKAQKIGQSPSFFNDMELGLVQEYVTALTDRHGVLPEEIGIIAPYYRQVNKINKLLEEKGYDKSIEVGSVECFQGKEKRVIIITTVRGNCNVVDPDSKFALGFLTDKKRFNVALTRAKAKLIIIGNPLCLNRDEKWLMYMQKCRQMDTYVGFDAEIERNGDIQNDISDTIKRINGMIIE